MTQQAFTERQTGMIFIPMEEAICLHCQSKIPRENIVCQINPRGRGYELGPTSQRVRALCAHCDLMFELRRELRGGVWQQCSGVEIVSDPKRRGAFKRRITAQRGELDIADLEDAD